jgi:hypothetical protein
MIGVAGLEFTVTTVAPLVALQPLVLTVTVYDPEADTVIVCVVSPVDHK